jgi:hypothetical protein
MKITVKWLNIRFLLTSVYCPIDDDARQDFLHELWSLKPPNAAWIALGYFNLIYETRDKNNANLNRRLMGSLRHTLHYCELIEFALQNRKFTWSNERRQPTLIRLD